ncbi:MAG TPA: cation diffusion facilitator family transporter [Gemmatimonadales bacterium]|nr:cation diffusion facilitator family transporter [Gemmatimonadales bacterium]
MGSHAFQRGIRSARNGMLVNTVLALVKLVAGLVGNAYVLVADAVESMADVFSSLVVIGGLHIAARDPDDDYPFGYGKAEALAGAIVALVLIGAAVGITLTAIREIRTPHHTPAPFTLIVLVLVIITKEVLFRKVTVVGHEIGSTAVKSDAWHHRSDALTSAAAFIGISIALIGGDGWESADDWAALFAAVIIVINAIKLLRPAIGDLMDRSPPEELLEQISRAALGADDVQAIEKLKVRKVGLNYAVDLHVQANPTMSLHDAHIVSGKVKSAIRAAVPEVTGVLIHMEPYE